MPPIIGFQTYLSNAQKLVSQDAQAPLNGGRALRTASWA